MAGSVTGADPGTGEGVWCSPNTMMTISTNVMPINPSTVSSGPNPSARPIPYLRNPREPFLPRRVPYGAVPIGGMTP